MLIKKIREKFEISEMGLETIRDFKGLKNLETRRDETRISSRLAEKLVETLIFSSFRGYYWAKNC